MTGVAGSADWYLAPMLSAERQLDAAVDGAAEEIRRAEEVIADLESSEEAVTEDEIAQFRDYVTGPGRTPAWDAVAARVASGEITWRAVVEGELALDEGVRTAYETSARITSEEQLTSTDRPQRAESEVGAVHSRAGWEDDDDYFSDLTPFDDSQY
ncbi:hypothetical protein [Amycolatopsis aidingensis]|uniref:hypothetical protein n=1 Tax=Amycolatopsis aidingensis TaxID=2842453 RepID=UPI001C0D3508|nr:hypothetical protein [Amycolatopsis aidingensis]